MPNVRLFCRTQDNEGFEADGATSGPVEEIGNLRAFVIVQRALPIRGLGEGPIPTFTATILGLPDPPELETNAVETDLSAQVRDQNGDLVDATYDPTRWTWAIDADTTGGASFGGVDSDDLTIGPNPGSVTIRATHIETGAPAIVQISVVATITFSPILRGLPNEVVEEESYPLFAEVLNSDGSVQALYNPADWTPSITAGGAFASLGGVNGDVLTINAASAGNNVTVQFDYIGALNISPTFDKGTTTIVAAAAPFPEVLEPAGMTVILGNQGDTTDFGAGWNEELEWTDTNRLSVVVDGSSKFGNVLERVSFIGDSLWLGALNRGNNVANHRTLYVRYVFQLSSNWQRSSSETLFTYGRKNPGEGPDQFNLQIKNNTPGVRWFNGLTGLDSGDNDFIGTYEAQVPEFSVFAKGTYHTLELLHRLNTNGNADGFLRVAVNGTEITAWNILGRGNNVDVRSGIEWASTAGNWQTLRHTGLVVFHKWDLGEKSVNDSVLVSELYIAGSNP